MTRLPTPGSDDGTWGDILNSFLEVSHASDGTLNSDTVDAAQLKNGAVTNAKLDGTTQASLVKADSSLQQTSNLSDLTSASTARTNLGLGGAAVLNVGTTSGTVAAGDDSRLSTYSSGVIGSRPTPASFGIGYYFATDDNGGTLYHSDGTGWTKITVGLNWGSGTQLAYAEDAALSFSAKTVGTTATDLSAPLRITIPASSVPVKLEARVSARNVTGGTTVGANCTQQLLITDGSGTSLTVRNLLAIQVVASAAVTWSDVLYITAVLPAPVASGTYKLQGRVVTAVPSGWSNVDFLSGGVWPTAWIQAVAE